MNILKHIKGVGFNSIGLGFYYISMYANLFILNELLTDEIFGKLQMIIASSYILSAIVMGGMQSFLAINLCRNSKYDKWLYKTTLLTIFTRYLLIFVIVLLVSYYEPNKILAFITLLSFGVTLNLLVDSVFINFDDVRFLAIRKFAAESMVFFACAMIYFKQANVGMLEIVMIYSACYFIIGLTFVAISVIRLKKLGNHRSSLSQGLTGWSIQKLSMPYFLWTIIQAAIGRGSILFVGYTFGAADAGLWRLFQSGIQGAQSIASAGLSVVVPREVRDNPKKDLVSEVYSRKVLNFSILFSVALSSATFVFYYIFLITDLQSQNWSLNLLVLGGLISIVLSNTYFAIVSVLLHWSHEVASFLQQQLIFFILTIMFFLTLYILKLHIDLSSFVLVAALMLVLAIARIVSTFHAIKNYEQSQN